MEMLATGFDSRYPTMNLLYTSLSPRPVPPAALPLSHPRSFVRFVYHRRFSRFYLFATIQLYRQNYGAESSGFAAARPEGPSLRDYVLEKLVADSPRIGETCRDRSASDPKLSTNERRTKPSRLYRKLVTARRYFFAYLFRNSSS